MKFSVYDYKYVPYFIKHTKALAFYSEFMSSNLYHKSFIHLNFLFCIRTNICFNALLNIDGKSGKHEGKHADVAAIT